MTEEHQAQWHIAGQAGEIGKLHDGLVRLEGTRAGNTIAATIRQHGTTVRFGQIGQDVIAHFDPDRNEIVIHQDLRDASPNVLAAHLAHEGTHVQWDTDDSIDQEYHTFEAQAAVWEELKGDETDDQCDWVSWIVSLGERQAKKRIRRLYPDLPEYG